MIELISALLALCSVGVFAAHALDAYRTTHYSPPRHFRR